MDNVWDVEPTPPIKHQYDRSLHTREDFTIGPVVIRKSEDRGLRNEEFVRYQERMRLYFVTSWASSMPCALSATSAGVVAAIELTV
jgi:hypothetical protein